MSRPKTIRNETILNTARRLFLEGGYGVSTAEIAREAGVSEGSIFNRFGTKSGLFHAAMGLPALDVESVAAEAAEHEDVRAALACVGRTIVSFLGKQIPRVMMLWAQPALNPLDSLRDGDGAAPPQRILRAVTGFLQRAADDGRIRVGRAPGSPIGPAGDPSVAARMFIGALHGYVFFHLIEGRPPDDEQAAAFVADVVDTLWEGIRP